MENQEKRELIELIDDVEKQNESDVFVYAGTLIRPNDEDFISACSDKKNDRAFLMLTTLGGDAAVAYRIARHLQKQYKCFSVYINTLCKSAGTLVALGADKIIMSDYAEMGPLDVQILKADELGERSSGLTIYDSLDTLQTEAFKMFEKTFLDIRYKSNLQITTKSAMDVAANIIVGLYNPIFAQIDPMRMGEFSRAIRIAWDYGQRIGTDNLKSGTISKLIMGYPDHGFIIDYTEAKELFNHVREASDAEQLLADRIEHLVQDAINKDDVKILNITSFHEMLKEELRNGGNHGKEAKHACKADGQDASSDIIEKDNRGTETAARGIDESTKTDVGDDETISETSDNRTKTTEINDEAKEPEQPRSVNLSIK